MDSDQLDNGDWPTCWDNHDDWTVNDSDPESDYEIKCIYCTNKFLGYGSTCLKCLNILEQQRKDYDAVKLNNDYGPIATPEQIEALNRVYSENPALNSNSHEWIQTYTGKKFYPLNPRMEDICIEDIAHALSMLCRFTGHSKFFYSVAEHCVLVSYFCDSKDSLAGLLHDASEGLGLNDISSPIKRSKIFEGYRNAEDHLQRMIYKKFGLPEIEPLSVKLADKRILCTEAKDCLGTLHKDWKNAFEPLPIKIMGLNPKEAEALFLKRFEELNAF